MAIDIVVSAQIAWPGDIKSRLNQTPAHGLRLVQTDMYFRNTVLPFEDSVSEWLSVPRRVEEDSGASEQMKYLAQRFGGVRKMFQYVECGDDVELQATLREFFAA